MGFEFSFELGFRLAFGRKKGGPFRRRKDGCRRVRTAMSCLFASATLLVSPMVQASLFTPKKELLSDSIRSNKWDEVIKLAESLVESSSDLASKDLYRLVSSIALQRQGRLKESMELVEAISEKSPYHSWANIFLSRLAYTVDHQEFLKKGVKQLQKKPLKGELLLESRFFEGHLLMGEKKWKLASDLFRKLEKPTRGTELHIPVLEAWASALSQFQGAKAVCQPILIAYSRYPHHLWFKGSAPEIKGLSLGAKTYSCAVSSENFEKRLRHLNHLGDFQVANEELAKWFRLASISLKNQRLMLAKQRSAEGHPEDAVKILKELQVGKGPDLELLLPLSFAAAKSGEMDLAIQSSLLAGDLLGSSKKGAMARYQAASWAYQTRNYDQAESLFKQLKLSHLSGAYQKEVQWYMGWLRYLKGDYVASEKMFRALASRKTPKGVRDSQDRIHYWMAMSQLKLGKLEKAKSTFMSLSERTSFGYYTLLSKERLKQLPELLKLAEKEKEKMIESPIIIHVLGRNFYPSPYFELGPRPSIDELERDENQDGEAVPVESEEGLLLAEENANEENGLDPSEAQTGEGLASETSGSDYFSQSEANQKLDRARAFWSLGLSDLARREITDLERYSRGFEMFKKISNEYRSMELYNKLATVGQGHLSRANMKENKFIYEAVYPRAFAKDVEKHSRESGVPQALIWAIMRAESMYRPWVKSPVGAIGLMQIMPFTGQRLAQLMGEEGFIPQVLLQPPEAIRFGVKYLDRLSKKFDQSVQLVAAAYNAGPHRVSQWLYYFGYMQMDEWVEHIPFLETRNYVKKVSVYYMAYNEIYGKELGDRLTFIEEVPVKVAGAPETKENWE